MRRPWRTWAPAPRRRIPRAAQEALRARVERHARTKWKGHCRAVVIRFRGAFACVDAFPLKQHHLPGTSPEERARLDAIPVHLCRLGYLGSSDFWEYAFFKYSDEKYAPSVVASGSFVATPEQAFDCSAGVYLPD